MNPIIYHNPRCSKSRQALQILKENGIEVKIINYLQEQFTLNEITKLLKLLKMKPIQLVRKNEQVWKEHFKDKQLTDSEVIMAMLKYPKLIERPIVVHNNNAIIGRPPEDVLTLF